MDEFLEHILKDSENLSRHIFLDFLDVLKSYSFQLGFDLGRGKKSLGAKSGEYGGCQI